MRYSYAWEVSPADLDAGWPEVEYWMARYVRVVGRTEIEVGMIRLPGTGPKRLGTLPFVVASDRPPPLAGGEVLAVQGSSMSLEEASRRTFWMGRLFRAKYSLMLDSSASRFTGASVAGLVVGAMGVFVFAVALRHWHGERRAFEMEAAEG
jgi:hypothetical protein